MKNLLAALIISFLSLAVRAQNGDTSAFLYAEQMPEYPGGLESLNDYMRSNINYPKEALDSNIQGKIRIRFKVDIEGNVKDPELIKMDVYRKFGSKMIPATEAQAAPLVAEAMRVIRFMRPWKPGMQDGRRVAVYYIIPVSFVLPPVEPLVSAELMPQFPGGNDSLQSFLSRRMQYPDSARKEKIHGTVTMKVVVLEDGVIDSTSLRAVNIELYKRKRKEDIALTDVNKEPFIKEATRLLLLLPEFRPGFENSRPVPVSITIPVQFKLPAK